MDDVIAERMSDPDAALLARSILGTDDPGEISRLVAAAAPVAEVLSVELSVGAVFGVNLRDGTHAVLKRHLATQRLGFLRAAYAVQAHLARRGFPCPKPLQKPIPGPWTLEERIDEGVSADAHRPEVRDAMARALALLVSLCAELPADPALVRDFPSGADALWPVPHNVFFDFEATATGAEWIDEIASAAKLCSDSVPGRRVVAHADWSVKHFRFVGDRIRVIHDWDSLQLAAETSLVGHAAATFTNTWDLPVELAPTPTEARAFVAGYETARGEPFSEPQRRALFGAATYGLAYGVRCEHALRSISRADALRAFADEFL